MFRYKFLHIKLYPSIEQSDESKVNNKNRKIIKINVIIISFNSFEAIYTFILLL